MTETPEIIDPIPEEFTFSLEALDYPRVREELASRIQSDITRKLVDGLVPSIDPGKITYALDETSEAKDFLDREKSHPVLSQMDELTPIVIRAGKGGLLNIEQILAVGRTIRLLRVAADAIGRAEGEYPIIGAMASRITRFSELEEDITRCIHPEGWILDSASSALRKIRKSLEEARRDIENRLKKLLQKYGKKGYLREDNFTMKNDRYVLPFRNEHLREEKVVIQSVSESRQTFFVEPLELVERNNNIQKLKGEEAAEEERILYELTVRIGDNAREIIESVEQGIMLDFAFAKGRLSQDWAARVAVRGEWIEIIGVRHPFLKGTVTPVDILIGSRKGLIITGPNAGGKTVALKSMGLLMLLNQSGLHVPAADGTTLPIFRGVFAEIGDKQNIDLSLSSFSAHIEFLKGMLKCIDDSENDTPVLVLLDEIGRSTDPLEGSALALSVIEYLLGRNAFFAITTHLPALKNLVMEREDDLAAASVEFDIENVQPMYRLVQDSLGASYALLMSERFGLDTKIVDRAREIAGEGRDLLEVDVTLLQAKRDSLKLEIEGLAKKLVGIEDQRIKLLALQRFILADVLKGVESAYRHAIDVVEKAEKQRERIIGKVVDDVTPEKDAKELEDELVKLKRMRNLLRAPVKELTLDDDKESNDKTFSPGERVWLLDVNREGEIIGEGRKGQYKVAVESMKMTVDASGIRKVEALMEEKPKVSATSTPIPAQVYGHIDLHGERVEEGLRKLDEYLDSAYYSKREEVRVVHGIGTGQLRKAVRQHLKKHDLVDSFRSGTPDEGGVGATIVRFRE